MIKTKYIVVLLLMISISAFSYIPSKNAEFSIITASSGKEIYKIYGHTAIRFQDKAKKKDNVYNYGLFSFEAPHFILNYLRGYNYYLLGEENYKHFISRYNAGGERVYQQTLNLTNEEVKILYKALKENTKPENREYLYNVFYDNCATRVYKIIDSELEGGIIWDKTCPDASYRELLHEYNDIMPFSQMGIDLVFGIEADKNTTFEEQLFLPEKLMNAFDKAQKSNGQPLISETKILLEGRQIHNHNEVILFNILFVLLIILTLWVRYKKTSFIRLYRNIIYSLLGIASLVVCFIAFFSIHPTVLPNLNLIWMNPLWLIFAIIFIAKRNHKLIIQKILNGWSIVMAAYLILGVAGVYYLHYGFYYILTIIILISYKRINT